MKQFDKINIDELPQEQTKGPQKLLFMTILALVATIYAVIIILEFMKEVVA